MTTSHLSAEDADTPPSNITFELLSAPMLGHLAYVTAPGKNTSWKTDEITRTAHCTS